MARLTEIPDGKLATAPDKKGILLGAEPDAMPHVERLGRAAYRVTDVQKKERKRSPAPPFTTSTLQQEAARKLGYSARKTMSIAQRLYEGVSLAGEGSVGLITYMRTDSVNIADSALREIAELVKTEYGPPTRWRNTAGTRRARGTRRRRTKPSDPRPSFVRPSAWRRRSTTTNCACTT